ncbi:MAG: shikimate kinase [Planctomycetota bacterium JB042]
MPSSTAARSRSPLLVELGRRVRERRRARGETLASLAKAAALSTRFLSSLEAGRGNISVVKLEQVARALDVPIARLFPDDAPSPRAERVALVGLRGAGKTTVGRAVAERLGAPFVELDQAIEEAAGMSLADIFGIHGEPYYRRLERETARRVLDGDGPLVLAASGGVVTDPETWSLLRDRCLTVWLRATPDDHWNRVVAQGDRRPMEGNPRAMAELRALLESRGPLYEQADRAVDTSGRGLDRTIDEVVALAASTRAST